MFGTFKLIERSDALLENAWRSRNWASFVFVWLAISVALVIISFLMSFIPGALYIECMRIYHTVRGTGEASAVSGLYSGLWWFSVDFGLVSGLLALILTVPAMITKELSGGFKPQKPA